jgi:hypothetical protein
MEISLKLLLANRKVFQKLGYFYSDAKQILAVAINKSDEGDPESLRMLGILKIRKTYLLMKKQT